MRKTQKIGWIGGVHWGLSLLYIILMFTFAASDSSYFNKSYAGIMVSCYGFLLFVFGLMLFQLVVGNEGLRQIINDITYFSTKDNILDQKEEENVERSSDMADLVLLIAHLTCSVFLFLGQGVLEVSYAIIMTMGFVYAVFWLIMGLPFMSMIKNN